MLSVVWNVREVVAGAYGLPLLPSYSRDADLLSEHILARRCTRMRELAQEAPFRLPRVFGMRCQVNADCSYSKGAVAHSRTSVYGIPEPRRYTRLKEPTKECSFRPSGAPPMARQGNAAGLRDCHMQATHFRLTALPARDMQWMGGMTRMSRFRSSETSGLGHHRSSALPCGYHMQWTNSLSQGLPA